MANKLILKRSSVASKVPLATDLEPGELAVNLADQKLYSKKSDGTVILVGSGLGGAGDVQGPASSTDNAIARFDGATGKIIQNSATAIDDVGSVFLGGAVRKNWNADSRVAQIGLSGVVNAGVGAETYYGNNWYFDGTNDKRIAAARVARAGFLNQAAKTFVIQYGANGSADSNISFEEAMLMNENGVFTKPKNPAFIAYNTTGGQQVFNGANVVLATTAVNTGNHYNTSNGRFTAPVTGLYYFSIALRNEAAYGRADIRKNGGTSYARLEYPSGYPVYSHNEVSTIIVLAANDYVDVYATGPVSADTGLVGDHFSGYLIS